MANAEQLAVLMQGADAWNRWRKNNGESPVDLSGAVLDGGQFTSMDLRAADFSHVSAKGANFANSDLRDAVFVFADLSGAVFLFCGLKGADMRGARLADVSLEDADLRGANLAHASLERAMMAHCNCRGADLIGANMTGVNLSGADLADARVSSVIYDRNVLAETLRQTRLNPVKLWEKRDDLVLDTTMRCKGMHAASLFGSQRFRIFLNDQSYLEEMTETKTGRLVLFIWWVLSDCGRSALRWAGWSLLFAFIFAFIFWRMGTEHFHAANLPFSLKTTLYYSIVTFTTLGFGDIAPKTECAAALITAEVLIGYIMLGGLISIFANKLARRSE